MDYSNNTNTNDLLEEHNQKIQHNVAIKKHILSQLDIDYDKAIMSLSDYEYIDDLKGLQYGACIRFIDVEKRKKGLHYISSCGFYCDSEFSSTGTCIIIRTFNQKIYKVRVDNILIFQKFSQDDLILNSICYMIKNGNLLNKLNDNNSDSDDSSSQSDEE